MYPHFVAFTSEVKSKNVHACTLRMWRARTCKGRTQSECTVQNSGFYFKHECWEKSVNQWGKREASMEGSRHPSDSNTLTDWRAAPQFGQPLTTSINWCIPVNELTAQHWLSLTDNATENRPQPVVPQFAALRFCFNKPWNEVPLLQRKQELQQAGPIHLVWCKKKKYLECWKMSRKKEWRELIHPTAWVQACGTYLDKWHGVQRQRYIFPSLLSVSIKKQKKPQGFWGLWNMLTQANESREEEEEKYKETNKEREQKCCVELQRMDNSCCSIFPLRSGWTLVLPSLVCAHITNSHESFLLPRQIFCAE